MRPAKVLLQLALSVALAAGQVGLGGIAFAEVPARTLLVLSPSPTPSGDAPLERALRLYLGDLSLTAIRGTTEDPERQAQLQARTLGARFALWFTFHPDGRFTGHLADLVRPGPPGLSSFALSADEVQGPDFERLAALKLRSLVQVGQLAVAPGQQLARPSLPPSPSGKPGRPRVGLGPRAQFPSGERGPVMGIVAALVLPWGPLDIGAFGGWDAPELVRTDQGTGRTSGLRLAATAGVGLDGLGWCSSQQLEVGAGLLRTETSATWTRTGEVRRSVQLSPVLSAGWSPRWMVGPVGISAGPRIDFSLAPATLSVRGRPVYSMGWATPAIDLRGWLVL